MPDRPLVPPAPWHRLLLRRLGVLVPAKMVGTTVGIGGFFAAYFWLLHRPGAEVTEMPLLALDRWIGLQPAALPVYLSLWVYVSLAPALVGSRRELGSFAWCSLLLAACGLGVFALWPTSVPLSDIDWSEYPSLVFLKTVDASRNACPSMHVAFAVFSAVWIERMLRQLRAPAWLRAGNWLWAAGILYSTVATRQHVVIDVLAGLLLGGAVAALNMHVLQRPPVAARAAPVVRPTVR